MSLGGLQVELKRQEKTGINKLTVEIDDAILEDSEFESYELGLWRKWREAEAAKIAKEIDRQIMESIDKQPPCFGVVRFELPDKLIDFIKEGVTAIKKIDEVKKELEDVKRELEQTKNKVDKLEGDLEYMKNGGYYDDDCCAHWRYPLYEYVPPLYPIVTCIQPEILIQDIFKATV